MSDSEHDWLRPEEETESETIIDAPHRARTTRSADVVAKIASLRQSIDNVDTAIVSLLAERFKYTSQVGVLKARAASRRPITSVNMPRSSVCIALPTKPDWIRKSPKCTANSW